MAILTGNNSNNTIFGTGVTDIISGAGGDDNLFGEAGADGINGGTGNDFISGGSGGDTINGGDGDDVIAGGEGADQINGDDGVTGGSGTSPDVTTSNTTTIPSTGQSMAISLTMPDASASSTESIHGFVSTTAVTGNEFNIAFVVDVSGSTGYSYTGTPVGDLNGDGFSDEIIDGEIAGGIALLNSIINDANLPNANMAVIPFDSAASTALTTTASVDADNNGVLDIEESLRSLNAGGSTDFEAALDEAIAFFNSASAGNNRLIFLSDGEHLGSSSDYTDEVQTLIDAAGINAEIRAIGIGSGASEFYLDLVDDAIDNDSAEIVTDPGALSAAITGGGGITPADIDRVEIFVNGALYQTIPSASLTATALGLRYDVNLTGLSPTQQETITARVVASDAAATTINTSQVMEVLAGGSVGGDDIITGGLGEDTLRGNAGNDRLDGGEDNDDLFGGEGIDILNGDRGNDLLHGGAAADILHGGNGSDTASYAGSGAGVGVLLYNGTATGGDAHGDTLIEVENAIGSSHADTLIGTYGVSNFLSGGIGNDNLFGLSGIDALYGGEGNDLLEGGADADTINGGNGVDTASYATSNGGVTVRLYNNTTSGGHAHGDTISGIENIRGSVHTDALIGSYGVDNVIEGGAGADYIDGLTGRDTTTYVNSTAGVAVRLYNGTGLGGDAHGDTLVSIENAVGSAFNDTLIGTYSESNYLSGGDGHDNLFGLSGTDALYGGLGNDMLDGGSGNDVLNGGGGNDTATYSGSTAGVSVRLYNGATAGGDAAGDILTSIENLIGSTHDDVLVGTQSASNFLSGGVGDDILYGLSGTDALYGGLGDDFLQGGSGADAINGGAGSDTTSYVGSTSNVTVRLYNGTAIGGDAHGDALTDIENVVGTAFADALIGANNTSNILEGGAGADYIDGLTGNDTAAYTTSTGGVTVRLYNGTGTGNDAHGDTLVGIENVIGSNHADALIGTYGTSNIFEGGAGADYIDGLSGTDTAAYTMSSTGVTVRLYNGTGTGGDAQGDTLVGIENLMGSDHADLLLGSNGVANVINGGEGSDHLFGLTGTDTFAFDDDFGNDAIHDFENGSEFMDMTGSSLTAGDLRFEVSGGDTIVHFDNVDAGITDTITLTGITSGIDAGDFLF